MNLDFVHTNLYFGTQISILCIQISIMCKQNSILWPQIISRYWNTYLCAHNACLCLQCNFFCHKILIYSHKILICDSNWKIWRNFFECPGLWRTPLLKWGSKHLRFLAASFQQDDSYFILKLSGVHSHFLYQLYFILFLTILSWSSFSSLWYLFFTP